MISKYINIFCEEKLKQSLLKKSTEAGVFQPILQRKELSRLISNESFFTRHLLFYQFNLVKIKHI